VLYQTIKKKKTDLSNILGVLTVVLMKVPGFWYVITYSTEQISS